MLPYLKTATLFLLLLLHGGAQAGREEEYITHITDSFPTMNWDQLLSTWHTDCHRRCNQQLFSHVETACENDPYRLEIQGKRSGSDYSFTANPFLPREVASTFLHKRSGSGKLMFRRKKSLIMEECCFRKDCAWEEYAEYCHGHNRRRRDRVSDCS